MEDKKNCINNGSSCVPDKNVDNDIGPSPPQDICNNKDALREW